MAYDSPRLGGYQIKNPPKPMRIFWEAVQQVNELADGSYRQRILGYRLNADLIWGNGWIREDDLTGLMAVANDTTASLTFVPRPDSKPSLSYEVQWHNKFEFQFHEGRFWAYGGQIELISPEPTSTVGELP